MYVRYRKHDSHRVSRYLRKKKDKMRKSRERKSIIKIPKIQIYDRRDICNRFNFISQKYNRHNNIFKLKTKYCNVRFDEEHCTITSFSH